MIFTEFLFFPFFIVCWAVYWSLRGNNARKLWLLACSYYFYSCWDWRFLALLAGTTVIDYFVALRIEASDEQAARKRWLVLSIIANLGVLGFFKYFDFFIESAVDFTAWIGLPLKVSTLRIILPVGISFYTFQSMSYTIDVYRGRLPAEKSLTDFALFVSFFTHLVAGPIVRAIVLLPQFRVTMRWRDVDVRACLVLFLIGYIKKACISDNISPTADAAFAFPLGLDALSLWIGALCYTAQIYCDFSGYTDMAIAAANLLGYELQPNFNFPYFARDITDFWRRWHMSLSTWLRDYLYIPLGGNRGSLLFTYRNLMITMLLGGLWHGAAWHFVIWGGLHGVALVAHREWERFVRPAHAPPPLRIAIGIIVTFLFVVTTWVIFRAETLDKAGDFLDGMWTGHPRARRSLEWQVLLLFPPLVLCHWLAYRGRVEAFWRALPDWAFAVLLGAIVPLALLFTRPNTQPFIYFQF